VLSERFVISAFRLYELKLRYFNLGVGIYLRFCHTFEISLSYFQLLQ
jgi:hypothetical protein